MMSSRRTVIVVPFLLLESRRSCGFAADLLLFEHAKAGLHFRVTL